MIATLLLAQTVTMAAPPIKQARPATTWSCDFVGADASNFLLNGYFAEAPVGSDPNAPLPTVVKGNGPAFLLGDQRYYPHASSAQTRRYMVAGQRADGSNYTILFSFVDEENAGLATITRYVPDQTSGGGKLYAFAIGYCSATFHPLGYKGAGK